MRKFAALMYDRRKYVLIGWILILLALIGVARAVGPDYRFDVNINNSEAGTALDLLTTYQPEIEGDTLTLAWKAHTGTVQDPAVRDTVETLLDTIGTSPNVAQVLSPYDTLPMAFSPSGTIGYATITLDMDGLTVPRESVETLVNTVKETSNSSVTFGLSGSSVSRANPPSQTTSEILGLAFAAIILIIAFGSLLAATLPLISALLALGASLSIATMLTHILSIPVFAPQLIALIGIGVGIDYALFVVARHRNNLMRGQDIRESVLEAMDSSGRAVLLAGVTVMIALLGMLVAQIGFLTGLAIVTSIGVAFTMIVTLTLLPSMLGFLGMRVLGKKARKELRLNGPHNEEMSTRWGNWSGKIQRRPWPFIIISTLLLAVLALPALNMRLGSADAGSDTAGSPTRIAYDILAEGFGPGVNGPLLLVTTEGQADTLPAALAIAENHPNVTTIGPVLYTPGKEIAYATVIPGTAPQDEATLTLIQDLRTAYANNGNRTVLVSGFTAIMADFAADLQAKLPWFLIGVLGLSSLLLMIAFRSIAIPVKAAIMNLAAAAASFGILTAVFQWGWFGNIIGVERTGPIDAFLPIMLLAILFGLSMDYQVFLVSRMREEWLRTKDNSEAVRLGLAETGRVITAAALIMIFVFAAFVFGGDRIIKMFGLGLAVAIFIDAFIIRSLLVPALMQVLGKWNWWLPSWLDRILPHVKIEPSTVEEKKENDTAGIGKHREE